jgi:orotidine-5'-phosphate decarboxylase
MTEAKTAAPVTTEAKDRLIVALDVESSARARDIVSEVQEFAGAFKIGLRLFVSAGPDFVRELCNAGNRIFLDLKFHDIPNTAAQAGVEAARLGVWMFNVHASGGNEMMRRVVSEVSDICENESLTRPRILGVTVLTSSADDTLRETGIEATAEEQVVKLAQLARSAGLDGVVASAAEARTIRSHCGNNLIVVTPGIRSNNASNDDQKRVTTPADAIRAGSDYLVVGRPITGSANMASAAREILREISNIGNE